MYNLISTLFNIKFTKINLILKLLSIKRSIINIFEFIIKSIMKLLFIAVNIVSILLDLIIKPNGIKLKTYKWLFLKSNIYFSWINGIW